MKRSLLPMRRARVASRTTFWTVNRRSPAAGPTLAQRYGNGATIRSQPFQSSVVDDTAADAPGAGRISAAEVLTLAPPPFAVRMLRNLSFGHTPASIAEFNGLGSTDAQRLANWVDWQLDWRNIDDSALDARIAAQDYTTLSKSLQQLWADHIVPNPDWEVRMRPAFEIQRLQWCARRIRSARCARW